MIGRQNRYKICSYKEIKLSYSLHFFHLGKQRYSSISIFIHSFNKNLLSYYTLDAVLGTWDNIHLDDEIIISNKRNFSNSN